MRESLCLYHSTDTVLTLDNSDATIVVSQMKYDQEEEVMKDGTKRSLYQIKIFKTDFCCNQSRAFSGVILSKNSLKITNVTIGSTKQFFGEKRQSSWF